MSESVFIAFLSISKSSKILDQTYLVLTKDTSINHPCKGHAKILFRPVVTDSISQHVETMVQQFQYHSI